MRWNRSQSLFETLLLDLLRGLVVDFENFLTFQPVRVTIRAGIESRTKHNDLRRPVLERGLQVVVDETCAYEKQVRHSCNFTVLASFLVVFLQGAADGVFGDELQLGRSQKTLREPIRIAHAGIRLAGAIGSEGCHHDRGSRWLSGPKAATA